MNLQKELEQKLGMNIADASNEQIYYALLSVVKEMSKGKERKAGNKKVYYISAECLIGKLLIKI